MDDAENRMDTGRQKRMEFPVQDWTGNTCPNCGSAQTSTTRSEVIDDTIRRRNHVCLKCPAKWPSIQTIPIKDREDLKSDASVRSDKPEVGKRSGRKRPNLPPSMRATEYAHADEEADKEKLIV